MRAVRISAVATGILTILAIGFWAVSWACLTDIGHGDDIKIHGEPIMWGLIFWAIQNISTIITLIFLFLKIKNKE